MIRDCFVTGKWKQSEDAEELLRLDDASDGDDEMFGDFEDLETGQKFIGSKKDNELDGDDETEGWLPVYLNYLLPPVVFMF